MSTKGIAAGAAVLPILLLAQTAAAGETGRFRRLFGHYNSIRVALAADSLRDVLYHAERLAVLAGALAREARRFGQDSGREIAQQLRAISDAARELERSTELAAAREAFARLSRTLLEYRGDAGIEDPVVVFCPLHNNVWLQPSGDAIGNPYMGAERARCGEVLSFRRPRWAPRRPARLSPSERPLQAPGRHPGA